MRLVLRPLLSFVVLAALVFALLQGVGRVTFALLSQFELAANQILAGRQIRLSGLRGDWHGFNPVLRVDRLDLPAGQVEDLYVELDLPQSLVRSRAVLHRARVGDAALLIERAADGRWRLAGMPGGQGFDPLPYLTGTDQLQFQGTLAFSRGDGPAAALAVDYAATNRSGSSRHRLILRNAVDECAAPCELRAELQHEAPGWGIGEPSTTLTVSATRFVLAEALVGFGSIELEAVEMDWREPAAATASGRALALLSGTVARDGQPFGLRLDAVAAGEDGVRWGRLRGVELVHGAEQVRLPPIDLQVRDGVVQAAVPDLALSGLLEVVRSALAWNAVADRWLGALALRSRVQNLRAFYRLETGDLGYGFDFSEFAMDGYRGVPWIRHAAGTAVGHTQLLTGRPQAEVGHRVQLDVDAVDVQVAFPEHVRETWALSSAGGRLQAFFRREELGFRAEGVRARIGATSAVGGVAVSRLGKDERDRRIAVTARLDRVTVEEARRFVPFTLPPRLYEWLTATPIDGAMEDGWIAYQGQLRVPPGEPGRRLEISGRVLDGSIRFHPQWPAVEGFEGFLEVAGREVRADAWNARSLGADLAGTQLRLQDNGASAELALSARADAGAVFELVRQSPMQRWMRFVAPDWAARGPLRAAGTLSIPIREAGGESGVLAVQPAESARAPVNLAVELAIELEGVALDLPGYRLAFRDLRGPVRYGYPDRLQSTGLTGSLFEAPVRLTAASANNRFGIELAGTARSADVWQVVDLQDPGLLAGASRFAARLDLDAPRESGQDLPSGPPRLTIRSSLEGMTLRLPAHYAKPAEAGSEMLIDLEFPEAVRRLSFSYRDATGWIEFGERLQRGSVGLGIAPAPLADDAREILVRGRLERLTLDELGLQAGSPGGLPVPVRFGDVSIDELLLGGFGTQNARVTAELRPDGFQVRLDSERLSGTARRRYVPEGPPDAAPTPIELKIDDLRLPRGSGAGDPLAVDLIPRVPPVDVVIDRMSVGDEDYGQWQFRLRSESGDLRLRDLEGRLRNVDIVGSQDLVWRGATNETTFEGTLSAGNLAEVLPSWGYAPSVESQSAQLTGTVSWPGSPAAFQLLALRGEAQVRADSGRFLDVDAGGGTQRILSLLNFTTIAKRMSLDFSDVFGKGLSFDKLKATIGLDAGRLEFLKPLDVEGTGLKFRMTGSVRLQDRVLDHEMIVTLPVSRGLPWYAAYVGLANPLAGLGVLVGERVLRKPLEQFSSAKYRISGTVENPKVELVSVFDTTTSERPVEVSVEAGPEGSVKVPAQAPDTGGEVLPDEAATKEQRVGDQ